MVPDDLSASAALITPVKEPSFRLTVRPDQFIAVPKEGAVSPEKSRVAPAPFIHQFPKDSVADSLPDTVQLGKSDPEVMHGKQPFPLR